MSIILSLKLDQFSGSRPRSQLNASKIGSISKSLAQFIEKRLDKINHYEIVKPSSTIPEITNIAITLGGVNGSHYWTKEGPGWVQREFIDELQNCINEKNKKYKEYRARCDECWLLMAANAGNPAQCFDDINSCQKTSKHIYTSEFDKTFYMEVTHKILKELTTECSNNSC